VAHTHTHTHTHARTHAAAEGGELHDYPRRGREDRENVYFLGMMLRLVTAHAMLTTT
jgi:hypothetical protein